MKNHSLLISIDVLLDEKMFFMNGENVLMDYDLAALFEISTRQLLRQVKVNRKKFPSDFMIEITDKKLLRTIPLSEAKRKKYYAFFWGGIIMTGGLFRTERANALSIQFVESFVKLCGGGFELLEKIARENK